MSRSPLYAVAALVCIAATPGMSPAAQPTVQSAIADHSYCTVCHGTNLKGDPAITIKAPVLAGIEPWYLGDQLRAYRAGRRGQDGTDDPAGAEMRTVARELTDAQINDLVHYVGQFKPEARGAATVQGDAARGRDEYAASCASCHGTQAAGNASLHAPDLARLNDWYVVEVFKKYQSNLRGASTQDPWAFQMHQIAGTLPAGFSIADVAAYLNTLPPEPKP